MKITIVQREIEEAVRAFIKTQIAVKDDMVITMDFSATRGEDGLIAAIDISPAEAGAKQVTDRQSSVASSAPTPATTSAAAAPPIRRRAVPLAAVPDEPEPAAEAVAEVAPAIQTDEPELSVAEAPTEDDPNNDNPPLRKSIFSNLHRPTNDASAAASTSDEAAA